MSDDTAIAIPPERTEVLDAPSDAVTVLACRNPITFERVERSVPEGLTIAEILERIGIHPECTARVTVGGVLIPEDKWTRVKPKRGAVVTVRVIPRGGTGNSGQTKNIMSVVLGVVLIVVGLVLAVGGVATFGATAALGIPAIMMGAGLLLSGAAGLIFPPTVPKLGTLAALGRGSQAEALAALPEDPQ